MTVLSELLTVAALLSGLYALQHVLNRALAWCRLPDLLGGILAGALIGPGGLGIVAAAGTGGLPAWCGAVQWAGLLMLMLSTGASLAADTRRGSGGMVVPLLVAASLLALLLASRSAGLVAAIAPEMASLPPDAPPRTAYAWVLALAAVVTSVPFLAKIFLDTGLAGTAFARNVLISACALDLIIWALLPVAIAIRDSQAVAPSAIGVQVTRTLLAVIALAGVGLAACRYYVDTAAARRRINFRDAVVVIAFAALLGALGTRFGIGSVVSMTIAGLCVGRVRDHIAPTIAWIEGTTRKVFAPLFFCMVGLSIDLRHDADLPLTLAFLIWSSLLKIGCIAAGMGLTGTGGRQALHYAIAMNTRGGPGIVLAGVALSAGLIGNPTFFAFVMASVLTAIATERWIRHCNERWPGELTIPSVDTVSPATKSSIER